MRKIIYVARKSGTHTDSVKEKNVFAQKSKKTHFIEKKKVMGNANACVAGGYTHHRCDIVITNNTDIPLRLDTKQSCGLLCDHKVCALTPQ